MKKKLPRMKNVGTKIKNSKTSAVHMNNKTDYKNIRIQNGTNIRK